jgi:hypothetical protein
LIITGPFVRTICLGSIGSRNGRLLSDAARLYAGGFKISGGSGFSFASSVLAAGVFSQVMAGFWGDASLMMFSLRLQAHVAALWQHNQS